VYFSINGLCATMEAVIVIVCSLVGCAVDDLTRWDFLNSNRGQSRGRDQ
jgi:hypothetical protein